MFIYAINTQYHAATLKSHCTNIEPLHLQHAVSPIDIALGQMAAIQKRLALMLCVAFAYLCPVPKQKSIALGDDTEIVLAVRNVNLRLSL